VTGDDQWVERLHAGHPEREQTVAKLHDLLVRVSIHELARRRGQLGSIAGPEFDDLAQQSADDALMNVLRRLDDFQGRARFTTWAYKFAMFEVSEKVARHAWRRHAPSTDELTWEELPDTLVPNPDDGLAQREQFEILTGAIHELSDRQREVFVAIALNDVSIDVLARRLGSNRNAVYKNLFDARRTLRHQLAAAGHPVLEEDASR
jgi:RNA polymerase sigma-70 factor (ECF subfamily)